MASRMQKFYVSIIRFCTLILQIFKKKYMTEFSYRTYHGSRCIDIFDCVNGWVSFSAMSATFSASEEDSLHRPSSYVYNNQSWIRLSVFRTHYTYNSIPQNNATCYYMLSKYISLYLKQWTGFQNDFIFSLSFNINLFLLFIWNYNAYYITYIVLIYFLLSTWN